MFMALRLYLSALFLCIFKAFIVVMFAYAPPFVVVRADGDSSIVVASTGTLTRRWFSGLDVVTTGDFRVSMSAPLRLPLLMV